MSLCVNTADEKLRAGKVSELFVYDNFSRVPVDTVDAGDICALTGLSDVSIGETVCSREDPQPLPTITVSVRQAAVKAFATPCSMESTTSVCGLCITSTVFLHVFYLLSVLQVMSDMVPHVYRWRSRP